MTQTEGNHGGNRRQSEAKLTSKEGTKHPQEGTREGSDARAGGKTKISSTGEHSPEQA
jgi:hypothetical protein